MNQYAFSSGGESESEDEFDFGNNDAENSLVVEQKPEPAIDKQAKSIYIVVLQQPALINLFIYRFLI
jgi:hypothetical protein